MNKIREDAETIFLKTSLLLKQEKLDQAESLINDIYFMPENYSRLIPSCDSLLVLKNEISRKIKTRRLWDEHWKREDPVMYAFEISEGMALARQPEVKEGSLDFIDETDTQTVVVAGISAEYKPAYSIELKYAISRHFLIYTGINSLEFSYSGKNLDENISFDFNVSSLSYYLGTMYLFRTAVGMRPHVALAAGKAYYKQESSTGYILYPQLDTSLAHVSVPYQIPRKEYSSSQILLDFGIMYVRNQNTGLIYELRISRNWNLDKQEIFNMETWALVFRIGLAIRL